MSQKYEVIDSDGHILEPVDLWDTYIDPKYRGKALELICTEDGREILRVEDQEFEPGLQFGLLGSIGARDGERPASMPYLEGRAGGFDPHERIKDMDREGIDAVVLYPSLGLFTGSIRDPDVAAAACRAYDRWLAEYCSAYPDRLFGACMLPMQSVEHSITAVKYAAEELGFKAAFMRPNPYNGRVLHSREYDPLWEVCQDYDIAMGIHEGIAAGQPHLGVERFEGLATEHMVSHMFEMMAAATSMLMMGVCDRFPRLRIAFLEASGGWMAGLLDRADRHFHDKGMNDTGLSMAPSELFRRQCYIAFEPVEKSLTVLADYIGSEHILWASDYPHLDGFWNAPTMIKRMGLSDQSLANVLGNSAQKLYNIH